jgi:hypothetical protein
MHSRFTRSGILHIKNTDSIYAITILITKLIYEDMPALDIPFELQKRSLPETGCAPQSWMYISFIEQTHQSMYVRGGP